MAGQRQAAGEDEETGPLWFSPPDAQQNRRALTRDRVVAEALAIISAHGAAALSMRPGHPPRRGPRRAVLPRPQQGPAV